MKRFLVAVALVCTGTISREAATAQDAAGQKSASPNSPSPTKAVSNTKAKKPAKTPPHKVEFQRLDSNRDGKLDADEFLGGSVGKAGDAKRQQHAKFDADQDGTLNTEDFWKYANRPAGEDWLRNDFRQRDKNRDGALSRKEYLGDKKGALKTEARTWFYRYDTDENEQVTLEEFLDRDPDRKVSIHNQFQVHDLDDDGQLTEQEFMRTRLEKSYEKVARENFARFDANGDRKLSEPEFVGLPGMTNQQAAIDRDARRQRWARLGILLAIALGPLLALAVIAWRYSRQIARRRKDIVAANANAPI
jgi:Ca2+-binding EF-hand superfamily protein